MQFITFTDPTEAISAFKGQILIKKGYRVAPEAGVYIGDLIDLENALYALSEVESHEADFTKEGQLFWQYALEKSDLKDALSPDLLHLANSRIANDSISQSTFKPDKVNAERIFCLDRKEADILRISEHLKIPREKLQSLALLAYDRAYSSLIEVFNSIFGQQLYTPLRDFTARKVLGDYLLTVYMFKSPYVLVFNPSIYIQSAKDGRGSVLRSDRETVKVLFSDFTHFQIDHHSPNFIESAGDLFLHVKNKAELISENYTDLYSFLEKKGIENQVISVGNLWNDIFKSTNSQ